MNFSLIAAQAADSGEKMALTDAAITAVFGYCVVFVGLILLMAVLYITGAIFKNREAKAAEKSAAAKPAANAAPVQEATAVPAAPGSAGHVKLHGVPDKEAAMIMAIVADKMQTPLNELRFISIKEVK